MIPPNHAPGRVSTNHPLNPGADTKCSSAKPVTALESALTAKEPATIVDPVELEIPGLEDMSAMESALIAKDQASSNRK